MNRRNLVQGNPANVALGLSSSLTMSNGDRPETKRPYFGRAVEDLRGHEIIRAIGVMPWNGHLTVDLTDGRYDHKGMANILNQARRSGLVPGNTRGYLAKDEYEYVVFFDQTGWVSRSKQKGKNSKSIVQPPRHDPNKPAPSYR